MLDIPGRFGQPALAGIDHDVCFSGCFGRHEVVRDLAVGIAGVELRDDFTSRRISDCRLSIREEGPGG